MLDGLCRPEGVTRSQKSTRWNYYHLVSQNDTTNFYCKPVFFWEKCEVPGVDLIFKLSPWNTFKKPCIIFFQEHWQVSTICARVKNSTLSSWRCEASTQSFPPCVLRRPHSTDKTTNTRHHTHSTDKITNTRHHHHTQSVSEHAAAMPRRPCSSDNKTSTICR